MNNVVSFPVAEETSGLQNGICALPINDQGVTEIKLLHIAAENTN